MHMDREKGRKYGILLLIAVLVCMVLVRNEMTRRQQEYEAAMAQLRERIEEGRMAAEEINAAFMQDHEAEQALLNDLSRQEEYVHTTDLPITMIGDSVMLGAAAVLQETFPNAYVNAEQNRSYHPMLNILSERAAAGSLGDPVVIGIGTNSPLPESACDQAAAICGDRQIFWLTTTNNWQFENRTVMERAAEKYDTLTLIDWDAASRDHPEYFYADGIHLTPQGRIAYADLIRDVITETCFRPLFAEMRHPRFLLAGDENLLLCAKDLSGRNDLYFLSMEDPQKLCEGIQSFTDTYPCDALVIFTDANIQKEALPSDLRLILLPNNEILAEENLDVDGRHLNEKGSEMLRAMIIEALGDQ